LGLVGLCAWQLPGLGLPVTIVGLVFSANALRRPQKSLAIAATVICGLGLALSAIAAIGEFLANNNGRLLPNPPAVGIIGLQKNELPLSSATIYGHWVEEDVVFDDSNAWLGSAGVIGERDGQLILVTNAHCLGINELFVADGNGHPEIKEYSLTVKFPSGVKLPVKRFGLQADGVDVAMLVVDTAGVRNGKDYVVLPFDDSAMIEQGAEVVAIGSPSGLRGTQTFGHISAIRDAQMGTQKYRWIQTDAAINQGNSGGPLFLRRQDRYVCIGINTWGVKDANSLGFAIEASILSSDRFRWCEATAEALRQLVK
jgi:S1-C subfamily serine protease